ncbi:MAG TPA: chemotaxis protein CheB [Candidatus Dormibacteraeota bacterium]|nr:chemotaxis protein CheB [Candidatus Dormibacteraeota bacterium]
MGLKHLNGETRDVVVVGGSAGALGPLKRIVADLPPNLAAAMLVVLHLNPSSTTILAQILNRLGGPPAVTPEDGDPLLPGCIYVASPDLHLDVSTGAIQNSKGPKVNGARPAIDVLFQSAAETYGPRVVGVILSGGLDDGSAGLAAIREAGGIGIVQHPDDAAVGSMPRNAIKRAQPEYVALVDDIGGIISRIVGPPAGVNRPGT